MAQLIDQAVLDDKQYLASLKRIDQGIDRMTKDAQKSFDGISKSAGVSGVQIGAVSGVVSSLVTQFIQLGQEAVGVLIEIGERSIETAIQFDTLKARLGGIFDGSQEAADQAFTFIQEKSKQLGIDLSELAGAFLPKTESLAQFERVAKIATALARSDPEQGAIGARIALLEALSGTFTSLSRRFEIPKEDINRIKEAFDKEGIEGFLTTLETVLKESGKSFDDLANTAQTAFSRLAQTGQQLEGKLGDPIVDALQRAAEKILSFVGENEDDLIVFADTIGRTIAQVIDLISGIDLGQLDTGSLIEFANYLQRIVSAAQLLVTQLAGLSPLFNGLLNTIVPLNKVFEALGYVLSNIDDALYTAAQAAAIAKASYAGLTASLEPLIDVFANLIQAAAQAATFDYGGAIESLGQAATAIQSSEESQAAFNKSIMESQAAFKAYEDGIKANVDAQDALRDSLNEAKNAGTGAADAIQAAGAAQRQAAEDAEKLQEAQTKVNEKFAEAEQDFQRKLEDIDIQTERKRLDIAIEFAQKREDAATKHLQRLEDIRRKNAQDRQDAAVDLERKEEDIARKFADERIDLEREQRQKRVDVERDYRLKLQDIQREFLLDAGEAERKRDAVAFLRAIRERDKKVQDAQLDRQRNIDETRITGQLRLEELRVQQQRELEEAHLANERKLEDLRTNLNRQIEEQNIAYERELADISLNEQRKNEELNRQREREIEDARRAYERKLEDLRAALEEELKLIEEFAAKKAEAEAQAGSSGASTFKHGGTTYTIPRSSTGVPAPVGAGGLGGPLGMFQHGGRIGAGQLGLVGERGPELFLPGVAGTIVPNESLIMPNVAPSSAVTNISNVRGGAQITLPDVAGLINNPVAMRQIRNLILSELDKVL